MPTVPDGSSRDDLLIDAAVRQFEALRAVRATGPEAHLPGRGLDVREPGIGSESLAGYELLRELHRGGQGVVYEALQKATKRKVAIKVLHESTTAAAANRRRFELEIAILSQLRHPNIVTVHDSGAAGGRFFYVMDLVPGVPLDRWIEKRRWERQDDASRSGARLALRGELEELLGLFIKICDAVNAAHLRGVIHRDLKPGNILVDGAGEPHVLDFGLAKYTLGMPDDPSNAPTMTQAGQFVGSLPWSSPEQASSASGEMDIRSDVYALGVLLYHALTGQFPYRVVGDPLEVLEQIRNVEPRAMNETRRRAGDGKPTGLAADIDNEVQTIVLKCLQKDRERRYQTAGDLGRDLQHYLKHEPIEAKRDSLGYVLGKRLRRYRVALGVAAGFMLLLVAGLITSLGLWHKSEERRQESEAVATLLQNLLTAANPLNAPNPNTTVRDLLEAFDQQRGDSLRGQPAVEARVRLITGRAYRGLGDFERADAHLQRAAELAGQLNGPDSDEVNDIRLELALVRRDQTRFSESREILEQVRTSLGHRSDAKLLIKVRTDQALAETLYHLGEYQPAQEAVQRALPHVAGLEKEDPSLKGSLLHTQAVIVEKLENSKAAIPMLRAAVASYEKVYSADHPELAITRVDLADSLLLAGENDEAEKLIDLAAAALLKTLGPDHPRVIYLRDRQAQLWVNREQYDLAEARMRELLDQQRRLGRNQTLTQRLNNLAELLDRIGRSDEAEPLLLEAIELGKEVAPQGAPWLAVMHNNLARVWFAQKKLAGAESMLRTALAMDERFLPPQSDDIISDLKGLGFVLEARGNLAEAIEFWRRIVAARQAAPHPDAKALSANRLKLAELLVNHGKALLDGGNFAEAEAPLTEAVALRRELLPANNWRTYSALSILGELQTRLGKLDDARTMLQDAYKGLQESADTPRERLNETIARLAALYTQRGEADEAARWRALLERPADSAPAP